MTDPKTHAQVAVKPTPEALIDLIGELGREVHNLLDDCETSGDLGDEVHTITAYGLERVSDVLGRIEELPFEELGYVLGPGAMLQAALKQTFMASSEEQRERIARLIHQDQKQLLSDYGVHPEVYQSDPELYSSAEDLTDTIIRSALAPAPAVPDDVAEIAETLRKATFTKGRMRGGIIGQTIEANMRSTFHEVSAWDLDRAADALEAQAAELARLRYVLKGVRGAIDIGRNEPLMIWRDQINIALDAALNPTGD